MVTIAEEPPRQAEVESLLQESDAFSMALYPPESNHLIGVEALDRPGVRFFVARLDGRAAGCGGLLLGQAGEAEIKRMIVTAAARGKGIGRAILGAIEDAARREQVQVIRLETGPGNVGALALYRRFGYRERGPFGAYRPDPLSIFMEKPLARP